MTYGFPLLILMSTLSILFGGSCSSTSKSTGTQAADEHTYRQEKQKNGEIKEKYWKLTSIKGQPVTVLGNREAHIILKEDGKLIGHGGCNSFFGTYTLREVNKISFKNIGSTEMMCEAMKTEEELVNVLQTTDSYLISHDTLFFHKGRMATLARFEAVYLY